MLAFVNGRCRILQGRSLPISSNVSSFSATAGTDLWESRVGKSATAPELQGQPGNDALVNSFLFSETRTRHKQPNRPAREVGTIVGFLAVTNCRCFS